MRRNIAWGGPFYRKRELSNLYHVFLSNNVTAILQWIMNEETSQ